MYISKFFRRAYSKTTRRVSGFSFWDGIKFILVALLNAVVVLAWLAFPAPTYTRIYIPAHVRVPVLLTTEIQLEAAA